MIAPIDEIADEEMEVDDDGEGAGDARAEPRADEPGDDPPPPRPREVRPKSNTTRSRSCAPTQFETLSKTELVGSVCVVSNGKSDHYHREAPQPMDGDVAKIQMDFYVRWCRRNIRG